MSLISLLLLLILGAITLVGYFLKDLPNLYRELKVEEFRGKNEKEIQKEAFFRQIKGSDIDEAFAYWAGLLVDMDAQMAKTGTAVGQKELLKMQQKVLMYGSTETVLVLSSMMRHAYTGSEMKNQVQVSFGQGNEEKTKLHSYKLMFYVASLISSLKKDFTGYRIEPLEILRLKINDIDSNKNKPLFDQAGKEVQKELKEAGVTI
ncbi:hypothetical protein MXF21_11445 [Enterococcus casseliflavus]|uniref:hypothetical protein n=1 Tax=Enterococcus casseliflavus TaxID=37734 RepID=UPI002DBB9946|nr:hypothetical protein [Enterococcus casseliflavus]MEB6086728.1 hypothetical protein [Enterococcus casseliflavus]